MIALNQDFQHSPDLRDSLKSICALLGVSFTSPERYVPSRWLSVFAVTNDTMRMLPALIVLYYGMLKSDQDKKHYYPRVKSILSMHGVLGTQRMAVVREAWVVAAHRLKNGTTTINHASKDACRTKKCNVHYTEISFC